jgi:hypothetical protein
LQKPQQQKLPEQQWAALLPALLPEWRALLQCPEGLRARLLLTIWQQPVSPKEPQQKEPPAEGGGEEGGGEEGPLLAAPGKRDDRTTTPRSKGKWYTPVKDDKRDMGARSRHYKGMWANELSKNTLRNTHKGALEFLSLGKGISEGQETNYKEEEQKLFEVKKGSKEIQEILRDMESDSETKTQ